ncbi:MAG: class I SAM-dependent methyltransferase [Candidatus Shikimatogenerans bostrichidophilus]|nr:MAG: class I SAM-dependent methyltransferase [Candidatus Shikimatogenerans bostrichidophilus]
MIINKKLYNYIINLTNDKEYKYLKKIRNKKYNNINKKNMSDFLQGRFLSIISRIKNPKYILEIGTFIGYSSLCLCEGLKKKGKLITIEKNKKIFKYAINNISNTKYKNKIKILLGNALNIIPKLNIKFDIIFIDADKKNYINYLNLIKNKIKKKGIILVDNVLWKGLIIKNKKDKITKIINNFNIELKNKNYNNIILPIRDGINLIIN